MMHFKHIILLVGLTSFFAESYAQNNYGNDENYMAPVCEDMTNCCDFCENVCGSGTFFASLSFLYWNARRSDLEYVGDFVTVINDPDLDPPKDVDSKANFKEPKFKWDPGVRASIGYGACDCGPNLFLTGNYFRSTSKGSFSLTPSFSDTLAYAIPIWNPAFMGTAVEQASEKWRLTFGTLDLLFGGRFTPWNCTVLMPNIGLRGAWIDQRLNVVYTNPIFFSDPPIIGDQGTYNTSSRFRAIGFRGGIDFQTMLFCNFGLTGGIGTSLVFGQINLKEQNNGYILERNSDEELVLTTVGAQIKRKYHRLRGNIETELGINYAGCCSCFGYNISATYMFSLWFDQNDFTNLLFTPGSVDNGFIAQNSITLDRQFANLMIQGLVVTVQVSF